MAYIPPTPPPSYNGGVIILQYPNQQIINSKVQFSLRGEEYELNTTNPYYNSLWPDFLVSIITASNDLSSNDLSLIFDISSADASVYWCINDAPIINGYFDSFDSHSIYKYTGYSTNPTPSAYPNNADNWTKVTSLSDIGAGAWFNTYDLTPYTLQKLLWDGNQILGSLPISASMSGSGGFLQITSSYTHGRITLTCVETSSTDPAGGKWIIKVGEAPSILKLY